MLTTRCARVQALLSKRKWNHECEEYESIWQGFQEAWDAAKAAIWLPRYRALAGAFDELAGPLPSQRAEDPEEKALARRRNVSPGAAARGFDNQSNQPITFKVHGEPAGVSWDWAGGGGCVSGVHSIGRGTVRCGRRLAGPARPVGWKLRAGISLRSGCGGWCRGGIEKGSVLRLLWEGSGAVAGVIDEAQEAQLAEADF